MTANQMEAMPPRHRAWLFKYLNQAPSPSAWQRRYLQAVVAADAPQIDLSDPGPGDAAREVAYSHSRGGAGALALKAFLYRTSGTPQHGKAAVLGQILDGLRTFETKQDAEGRFIWGDGYYYGFGAHEHGWRLEPIIFARVWLDASLTAADRAWIDGMIARAAELLLSLAQREPHRHLQYNNRGLVWCAVTQLCGLFLDDARYTQAAQAHARDILEHVVDGQGQVKEATLQYLGGGPDSGYTYTGWTYAMHYRMLSGDISLDARLLPAVRWLVRWNTNTGHALASGASVRRACVPVGRIADVLHALEFYRDREPWFGRVIHRWWPLVARSGGHCVHPCIWALLAHQPQPPARIKAPAWYGACEAHYSNPPTQYSIIAHR